MVKKLGLLTLVAFFLAGCALIPRNEEPVVPEGVDPSNAALITASGSLELIRIGPHRVKGMFAFSGPVAAYVSEGRHTVSVSYRETFIQIRNVDLVAGHEYLIAYVSNSRRIGYWIVDETTDEVIWGERLTRDDL